MSSESSSSAAPPMTVPEVPPQSATDASQHKPRKPRYHKPRQHHHQNEENGNNSQQPQQPNQHRPHKPHYKKKYVEDGSGAPSANPSERGAHHQRPYRGRRHHHEHVEKNTSTPPESTLTTTSSESAEQPPPTQVPQQPAAVEPPKKKIINKDPKSCLICAEDFTWHCVYENCEHTEVCWKCALKIKILSQDHTCCICKTKSENVILSAESQYEQPYQKFEQSALFFDNVWKIRVDSEDIVEAVDELRCLRCRVCNNDAIYDTLHELKNHLNKAHGLYYCGLCLENRKVFLADQKMYSYRKLTEHNRIGEKDENGVIRAHPFCQFCNKRFYNDDELFKHMNIDHMECFICKRLGHHYEYFRHYDHLFTHLEAKHFVCKHPKCLADKFVAFSTLLDLRAHEAKEHQQKKAARIDLSYSGSLTSSVEPARRRDAGQVTSEMIRFVDMPGNRVEQAMEDQQMENERLQSEQNKRKGKQKPHARNGEQYRDFEFRGEGSSSDQSSNSEEALKQKNAELIKKMREVLNNEKKFDEFRQLSIQFQKGAMLASEYYKAMVLTFGEKAQELFNDLIETFPEKHRQKKEALVIAHNAFNSAEFGHQMKQEIQQAEAKREKAQKQKKKGPGAPQPAATPDFPTLPASDSQTGPVWGGATSTVIAGAEKKKPRAEEFPTLGGASGSRPKTAPSAVPNAWFSQNEASKLKSKVEKKQEERKQQMQKNTSDLSNYIVIQKKKK